MGAGLTVGAAAEPIRQVEQRQFVEVRQRRIRGHRALAVIEAWRFRGRDQVGPDLQGVITKTTHLFRTSDQTTVYRSKWLI